MINTTEIEQGRAVAGRLPAGAEVAGMVREAGQPDRALVKLRSGLYVGRAEGQNQDLDQHAVHLALLMAERGRQSKQYTDQERARRRARLAKARAKRWKGTP